MKAGDLVSYWAHGEKHTGIVIDDDERNHTDVRFFIVFSPNRPTGYNTVIHRNYYDRLDEPMPGHPGEKFVEVISEIR